MREARKGDLALVVAPWSEIRGRVVSVTSDPKDQLTYNVPMRVNQRSRVNVIDWEGAGKSPYGSWCMDTIYLIPLENPDAQTTLTREREHV